MKWFWSMLKCKWAVFQADPKPPIETSKVIAELQNLCSGCAATGDKLAADICLDAIREIKQLKEKQKDLFLSAFIQGLREYAWWKDGTQYVGTCGTTLAQAIVRAQAERGTAGDNQ